MFKSMYKKFLIESEENVEILEQYNDGEGKLILKVNGKPVSVLEYEIYEDHCSLEFLETYIQENEGKGYATKLVNKLKEILKNSGIKTISANATTKSQHILKKVFGEPVSKKEFGWDEGIGDDLWTVKHNINESYLVEARSDYLLQNKKLVDDLTKKILKKYFTTEEIMNWMKNNSDEEKVKLLQNKFFNELENYKFIEKYLIWVVKQYLKNYWIFPEDCQKLNKELENFSKFNHTLDKKDINQYTFDEFTDLAMKLEGQQTSNEKERMIKDNEAEKVFENDNWLMIHPKTKEAAILYGRGTRWCTAATDSYNYFDHYNDQGPLYILINKHNQDEKFQFHWQSNQFMNIMDRTITNAEQEKILADPELHAKLREIVNKDYSPESYAEALYDSCGLDISPTTADRIKPDENGICHLMIIDSVFENMYASNSRDCLSWDFVQHIFTEEGLWEAMNFADYNYYYELDSCDISNEQYKAISKILVDNNLPTIPHTTIEYFLANNTRKIPEEYEIFSEIFEEVNENTEVEIKFNDCENYGAEAEATRDVERGILDYLSEGGYKPHFEWEKNERVIYMDVPAKDLKFPEKSEMSIFPINSRDYSESFGEYLVNTLYDGEECAIYEPQYGWDNFDNNSWDAFINDEYIPEFKKIVEGNPERNKKIREEWNKMNENYSIQKAVNLISEGNVKFKNNTFRQVFNKINEEA